MPPKTPPAKSKEELRKEKDDSIKAKVGNMVDFKVWFKIQTSDNQKAVPKSYTSTCFDTPTKDSEIRLPDSFDYVDVYVEGELVAEGDYRKMRCEGISSNKDATSYSCENSSSGNTTFTGKGHMYYETWITVPVMVLSLKKHLFSEEALLEPKDIRYRVIYYYKGNEICQQEGVYRIPEKMSKTDLEIHCEIVDVGLTSESLKALKKALKTYV